MNGDWFCSESCAAAQAEHEVRRAAARQDVRSRALPRLKLGLVLVHQGAITPVQLRTALESQQRSGRPLGREVVALGFADTQSVVRALATQAGVPCLPTLEATAVRACPELGAHAVRALGLVPFGVDRELRHLKVACAAPVPHLALAAVRELTGWSAEPFLVPDHSMPGLFDAYAALSSAAGPEDAIVPLDGAGARIAGMAAATPGAVVTQASVAPYLWVRVAGQAAPHNVFIPTGEETPWPAALTLL